MTHQVVSYTKAGSKNAIIASAIDGTISAILREKGRVMVSQKTTFNEIPNEKKALRQKLLKDRFISREIQKEILDTFLNNELWLRAKTVMLTVSFGTEFDTHGLIKEALASEKKVIVPKMVPEFCGLELRRIEHFPGDLIPGNFGILEPDPLRTPFESGFDLDLILVPGIAFTEHGYRLGYGGGYFDRFLPAVGKRAVKVSLIDEAHVFSNLPIDKHDVPVDYLFTESRLIDCIR